MYTTRDVWQEMRLKSRCAGAETDVETTHGGPVASRSWIPIRRRNFLVKHRFQIRFALYPILLLALFLVGASLYLQNYLSEAIEFQLYLPHSRLENPWDEVAPALARVAGWGGGVFLAALALWGWSRFARLKRDLNRLTDWMAEVTRNESPGPPPPLVDDELTALARGLHEAAETFQQWDRDVEGKVRGFAQAVAKAQEAGQPISADGLNGIREVWAELSETLSAVRVDEGLS